MFRIIAAGRCKAPRGAAVAAPRGSSQAPPHPSDSAADRMVEVMSTTQAGSNAGFQKSLPTTEQ